MHWFVFAWSALAVAAVMLTTWLVSLPLRNASIVDPVWSLGFVVIGWVSAFAGHGDRLRVGVRLVFVSIWGLRLSWHLFTRNRGHGEDFRYGAMRAHWGDRFWLVSLGTVFLFQGVLMWIVSLPLQFGAGIGGRTASWPVFLALGALVWAIGFGFESFGDAQLKAFRADPDSAGQVMDRGLWRYTRHPNYFGDACVWWGIFLVSVGAGGWAWAGVVGPMVMTTLLRRVSGVTLLERSLVRRRPGYVDYVARTSPFFPRPPRAPRT
jgi:steroid 5-alpha reductase family enzyme